MTRSILAEVLKVATALQEVDDSQYVMAFGRNEDGDMVLTLHDTDTSEAASEPVFESHGGMTNDIRSEDMKNTILFSE